MVFGTQKDIQQIVAKFMKPSKNDLDLKFKNLKVLSAQKGIRRTERYSANSLEILVQLIKSSENYRVTEFLGFKI